jgi:hypothetical protein
LARTALIILALAVFPAVCDFARGADANAPTAASQPAKDAASAASQPQGVPEDFQFLHPELDVPELSEYTHSGANDVRDILVAGGEFFVATGKGIARCRRDANAAKLVAEYYVSSGLPSDNVFRLKADGDGGIWALCEGGAGFLERDGRKWQAFTEKNGLAPGSVTNMAISPDGRRVWVTSTGGLAVMTLGNPRWKTYPVRNPIDVMPSPDGKRAWCRRKIVSACACGRHVLTSQLDLSTGKWTDVPDSGKCSHVAPAPAFFCKVANRLWLSGGFAPPLLYDPASGKTRTWPSEPNWEKIGAGNVVVYTEWFGQMLPFDDDSGRMWFATTAGLWVYDPRNDSWKIHRLLEDPDCGQARLARTGNGKTIYWSCDGAIASFDIAGDRWTNIWKQKDESYGEGRQELLLTPDEKYLWLVTSREIDVVDVQTKDSAQLTDRVAPGLSRPELVQFDPAGKVALVGTPRGVVMCDYAGKVLARTGRTACPIAEKVARFVFSPDCGEVWCIQQDNGGWQSTAAVLYPKLKTWEEVPDPRMERRINDVAFSLDGNTTWLSITPDANSRGLLERTRADRQWKPARLPMWEHYSEIKRLWLSPNGQELWLNEDYGCGLFRIKLAGKQVSQYVKSDVRQEKVEKHHALFGDVVKDLIFTPDSRYAVCSASDSGKDGLTLIDLKTGEPESFPIDGDVDSIFLSVYFRTVVCNVQGHSEFMYFDIETRKWVGGERKAPAAATQAATADRIEAIRLSVHAAAKKAGMSVAELAVTTLGRYVICQLKSEKGHTSICLFDPKTKSLSTVLELGSAEVTAMGIAVNGTVWFAAGGRIISVDSNTGKVSEFD